MGSTYTQIIYQIIFSTKSHERTITESKRDDLFKYIAGILKNKKCHLYRINGVEDHIHIITHIHPSVALADLVKDIKLASSEWIKKNKIFPYFNGWQDGYGVIHIYPDISGLINSRNISKISVKEWVEKQTQNDYIK